MSDVERLSHLVERIYDAALDAKLWPTTLGEACAYVDGCTANIFYQDTADHAVNVFYSWGEDPEYRQSYMETYAPLNPLFPAGAFLEVGTVHAISDIMPIAEFIETRMYREWVRPQGILDVIYCNLERTTTGAAAMAIRRKESDGLFDDEAKARFQLIVPHVRRAVSIGKVINFRTGNETAFESVLDNLAAAVLLVSSDSRVIFANALATTMFEKSDVLSLSQGRLSVVDKTADQELRKAIAAAGRGDAMLGVKGMAVSLAGQKDVTYVAYVLSLTSGNRRHAVNGSAAAAVFVRPISAASPSSLEVLAKAYRLTPSELRVLAAVMATGGIDDLAKQLGISRATVKTHLNHLYSKTGTTAQRDLIRLANGFASPFK